MMDTQRNTTRVPFSSTEPLSILQIIALVFKLATVLSSTLCSAAAGSKKALNPLYIICSEVNGGQSFWKKRNEYTDQVEANVVWGYKHGMLWPTCLPYKSL